MYIFNEVETIIAENYASHCRCPMNVTGTWCKWASVLSSALLFKSRHNRLPIDRLTCMARSIFQLPPVFKWQALICTQLWLSSFFIWLNFLVTVVWFML